MDATALNFALRDCHQTEGHHVPGSRYGPMGDTCGCESAQERAAQPHVPGMSRRAPHAIELNAHIAKIACQTCHIPRFARGGVPTKMAWDWSTAGKRGADGKPLVRKNDDGYEVYNGGKGDFTWARTSCPNTCGSTARSATRCVGDRSTRRTAGRHQPLRGQRRRRQVEDLAGEGIPRQAGVRPGEQDAGRHAPRRQRRHRVLEEPRLGEGREQRA